MLIRPYIYEPNTYTLTVLISLYLLKWTQQLDYYVEVCFTLNCGRWPLKLEKSRLNEKKMSKKQFQFTEDTIHLHDTLG